MRLMWAPKSASLTSLTLVSITQSPNRISLESLHWITLPEPWKIGALLHTGVPITFLAKVKVL